jgi:hypothetical protein
MRVVVDQMPADPVKPAPSKLPSWLQSKRNKALTGLGLLTLIAIPAIVAPVVVSQQKQQQQQQNALNSRDPKAQMARNAAQQNEDPDPGFVEYSPRQRTFNATGLGSLPRGNSTRLKVPQRSWTQANKTRAALTKPENWTPFIKIKDGQVGGLACLCGLE